jgi:hypothetical protein
VADGDPGLGTDRYVLAEGFVFEMSSLEAVEDEMPMF